MAFQQFGSPYGFKHSKTVVISHRHGGNLRVLPNNVASVDGSGGKGKFARFKVHVERNGYCKIQSEHSGKYLRIWQRGDAIDASGGGGAFTLFKVHTVSRNQVKLESDRFPGKYIAVKGNKGVKVGGGGDHCVLTFWKDGGGAVAQPMRAAPAQVHRGAAGGGGGRAGGQVLGPVQFTASYHFKANKRVVIGGPHGKNLRSAPNNPAALDCEGVVGAKAQWDVTIQRNGLFSFQNVKTGKYLRIHDYGKYLDCGGVGGKYCFFKIEMSRAGVYKLVSNEFQGKYVAVGGDRRPRVGQGGNHCLFTFLRQTQAVVPQAVHHHHVAKPKPQPIRNNNNNNNNGRFDGVYHFKRNQIVVIGGPHGKHLRVSQHNSHLADGQGGHGQFAQFEAIVHGNNIVQLKSTKTGDYLRIHQNGATVDVGGKGGQYTKFRYHVVQHGQPNVVKLESNVFPNKFVAIPQNYNVKVGGGGQHCVLTFWKRSGNGGNNNNNNNGVENAIGAMLAGAGVAVMDAQIKQNAQVIAQQQRLIEQQSNALEGQMMNMQIGAGGAGAGTYEQQQYPQQQQQRVCPLCGGKGYYGTFGFCEQTDIHKKGVCMLCAANGYVANANWTQCNQCSGKGCIGTFGACDRWDIHFKANCNSCNGYGYFRM